MQNTERNLTIRRYLLGSVSEEQRNEFEADYLADDHLFEEVVAVESDLFDGYGSGSLSESERRMFEKQFLSNPRGVERLEFAKALLRYPSAAKKRRSATGVQEKAREPLLILPLSWMQNQAARVLVASMILVAILAGSVWMEVLNRRVNSQLSPVHREQAASDQQQQTLPAQVTGSNGQVEEHKASRDQSREHALSQSTNRGIASFMLSAGLTRSGEQQKTLAISGGISLVRLQLNLERDDYSSYGLLLETAEGNQIWHKNRLRAETIYGRGKEVIVELLPDVLRQRDYVLTLTGVTPGGETEQVCTYTFRVVRR